MAYSRSIKIEGHEPIEINPQDAAARGLREATSCVYLMTAVLSLRRCDHRPCNAGSGDTARALV